LIFFSFQKTIINVIEQRCPTLSPFATCGDRLFKCGDKKFFPKVENSIKLLLLRYSSLISGDSKDFVATKVANVATRTF
jgi:hypothetical protein